MTDCYVDPDDEEAMKTFEMQQFKKQSFDSKFLDTCYGKEKCSVSFAFDEFAELPPS